MKKMILSLAAIAAMAGLCSCNPTCTCKTYANGVVVSTKEDVELDKDSYKKCSEMNTIATLAGKKNGVECK